MATRIKYNDNVIGFYLNILRSDNKWHVAKVAQYDAATGLHRIEFLSPTPILSGVTTNLAECEVMKADAYDLNHPHRRIRWYRSADYHSLITVDHEFPGGSAVISGGGSRRGSSGNTAQTAAQNANNATQNTTQTVETTAPVDPLKTHYSQSVLPSSGAVLCTSLSSGSRYILGDNSKLIKVFAHFQRTNPTNGAPSMPDAPEMALAKTVEEWRALQRGVTSAQDPMCLLYRRIRIFWPADMAWYTGRILRYNPHTRQHYIQYDDGDQRWYLLASREYEVCEEYGAEVCGRKVAIEMSHNSTHNNTHINNNTHGYSGTSTRWYVATVTGYQPDIGAHHLVYDDFPGEEEYADINARRHAWLVNVHTLEPGERILGRRISVYWSRPATFFPATITEYNPPINSESIMATPLGTKVLPLSRNSYGTPSTPLISSAQLADTEPSALQLNGSTPPRTTTHRAPVMRHPSYLPVEISPDATADIKIVYDDGDKQVRKLGDIRFIWLPDRIAGTPVAAGAVGLMNMGNTCYLNSMLQCLARVEQLAAYCTDESFHALINTKNDLGMGGRMALAFADLLGDLWGNSHTALTPGFIKALLSEKNALFNGMGQQDAHEALMCLLDAVHEDLCVPDHAATAAAVTDARLAAEEEEQDRLDKERKAGRIPEPVITTGMEAPKFDGPATSNILTPAASLPPLAPTPMSFAQPTVALRASPPASGTLVSPTAGDTSLDATALPSTSPSDTPTIADPSTTSQQSPTTTSVVSSAPNGTISPPLPSVEEAPNSKQVVPAAVASRLPKETTSIVKQLFFVHMQMEHTCAKGKHKSIRHGPRGGEMLPPLPVAPKRITKGGLFRKRVSHDPTVNDCLAEYFREEIVDRKCEKCGNKCVPVASRPWLNALPPVLVIQLKRFEFQPAANNFVKISDPVSYPLVGLDMSPYVFDYRAGVHGPALYDLFAVVLHVGSTDRGHYTSYARSMMTSSSQWYYFDDAKVAPVVESEVNDVNVSGLAYILFYAKRLPTRASGFARTATSAAGAPTATAPPVVPLAVSQTASSSTGNTATAIAAKGSGGDV